MSWYRITIKGRLSDRLAPAFESMQLVPEHDQTSIVGFVEDQSHLYGILDRVRSLGLDLISVQPTETPRSPSEPSTTVTSPASEPNPT